MIERIIGVLTLNAAKYREIAEDKSATGQAGIIVTIALLIQGFFAGFIEVDRQTNAVRSDIAQGIGEAVAVLISGLIAWVITAWVLVFIAKLFGGKTNIGEMLRVTGYVEIFEIVAFLSPLALAIPALVFVVEIVVFIVLFLELFGYVIGVSQAAGLSTRKAFITAIAGTLINFPIVVLISNFVLRALGISGA